MELFSLGELYVSDFLRPDEEPRSEKSDLTLIMDDETGSVRLKTVTQPEAMYGKYWYRSGINTTMKKELKDIVDSILEVTSLKENDLWLDIACNDGTLLSYVPKHLLRIGVDPADDSFKNESIKHANTIIQDYFSYEALSDTKFSRIRAKVITCIAMFYDIDEPGKFLDDVYKVLDDDGIFVMQLSYSPLMIKQLAFDNICHEHIYYYCLNDLRNLLEKHNMKVVDCHLNDVNGGSFRVFIQKDIARPFMSQPYRDVCDMRIESMLTYEASTSCADPKTWISFGEKVKELRDKTREFILSEKEKGSTIWAYAGSTKGNTLLQYFGLDNTLIDGIADRSTYKWGLRTVGTNIPIYSEDDMRKARPDYLLILAWHFIREFTVREKDYLLSGGKFIVPCPKFQIISKENISDL